jgi:transglutaminase-like putative cysteine protease
MFISLWTSQACNGAGGDWFVFDGTRGFSTSDSTHPAYKILLDRLKAGRPLLALAFTANDDWIALTGGSEFLSTDSTHPACREMERLHKDSGVRDLRSIAFTPTGRWVLLYDRGYRAAGIPKSADRKLADLFDNKIALRSVAFAPDGGWVILFGTDGVAYEGVPEAAAGALDRLVKSRIRVTGVTFTTEGDWFIVAHDGVHTNLPEHPAARKLREAKASSPGAASWIAFSPGDSPTGYTLTSTPSQRVKAVLAATFVLPRGEPEEWYVYGPCAPEFGGQREIDTKLTPNGRRTQELSALKRSVMLSRVKGEGNELKPVLTIHATLLARRLVPREGAAPPRDDVRDAIKLAAAEVQQYTRSSPTLDLRGESFLTWLKNRELRRGKDEDALAFARRAYTAIRTRVVYDPRALDLSLAAVCREGRGDCGGLSNLFVATLRANGIPARVLQGRWAMSEKAGEKLGDRQFGQWHMKSEFFATGIGWIPVDISSAITDPYRRGFAHFGNDGGDFVTFHLDQDLVLPSFVAGNQPQHGLQAFAHWWRGKGTSDGARYEHHWTVESSPVK